jgi:molybdopterin converting factor small subunit
MEQYEVTLRFGVGNARTTTVARGTTIGQLIADSTNRQALGYPNNVKALIRRVEQNQNTPVANGDVIDLETVGTIKA